MTKRDLELIKQRFPLSSSVIKRNTDAEAVGAISTPISQPNLGKSTTLAHESKERSASGPRLRVVVTSRRARLTDTDNICPKFLIDALRYKGLIPDDSPDHIILEVRQQKVDSKLKEGTLVEITPCP